MNPADISAIATAAVSIITAVVSLIHSIQTRGQLAAQALASTARTTSITRPTLTPPGGPN